MDGDPIYEVVLKWCVCVCVFMQMKQIFKMHEAFPLHEVRCKFLISKTYLQEMYIICITIIWLVSKLIFFNSILDTNHFYRICFFHKWILKIF